MCLNKISTTRYWAQLYETIRSTPYNKLSSIIYFNVSLFNQFDMVEVNNSAIC